MIPRQLAFTAALLLIHPLGWAADASYESTTQMTGGALVNTFMSSPFAPREARSMLEPNSTLTVVHGNQKAEISKDRTEIFDIDKQTITRIDNVKHTYTVMTFAQMRQMMKDMPQKLADMEAKMKQQQAQTQNQPAANFKTSFDTQVKDAGVTKLINGLIAQEWVVTMTTKVTNTNPAPGDPNVSITYVATTEIWIAPEPPEMKEIQDFDVRMYAKIAEGLDMQAITAQMKAAAANASTSMMFASQPGASDTMAAMRKEMEKIKGFRVMEVTSMSMTGLPPMPAGSAPGTPAPAAPSGGSVVGQVANDTATQTAAGESSKMGVFGNALASSALGAFHRKKTTPPPAAAPAPTAAPNAAGGAPGTSSNVLMTTTTQKTNFSHGPVLESAFQIPAGFKHVESPNGMF